VRFFRRRSDELETLTRAVEALSERIEHMEKALARQAREAGKSGLILERQASAVEKAAHEVRSIGERLVHVDEQRREAEREAITAEVRSQLVGEYLPILDGLWAAAAATAERSQDDATWRSWHEGLLSLHRRGEQLLALWDVHPLPGAGEPFDAEVHRIVEVAESAPPPTHPIWKRARAGMPGGLGVRDGVRDQLLDEVREGAHVGGPRNDAWVLYERRRGYRTSNRILRFADVVVWRGDLSQDASNAPAGTA